MQVVASVNLQLKELKPNYTFFKQCSKAKVRKKTKEEEQWGIQEMEWRRKKVQEIGTKKSMVPPSDYWTL